jgi:hypothetical protein
MTDWNLFMTQISACPSLTHAIKVHHLPHHLQLGRRGPNWAPQCVMGNCVRTVERWQAWADVGLRPETANEVKWRGCANAENGSCYLYPWYLLHYDSPPVHRQVPRTSSVRQTLSFEQEDAQAIVVGWRRGVPQGHQLTLGPQAAHRAAQLPMCLHSGGNNVKWDTINKHVFNMTNYNSVSIKTSPQPAINNKTMPAIGRKCELLTHVSHNPV